MGRPVLDSYTTSTGPLGPALKSNPSAYSERIIAVEVPDAPLGGGDLWVAAAFTCFRLTAAGIVCRLAPIIS